MKNLKKKILSGLIKMLYMKLCQLKTNQIIGHNGTMN